MKSNKLLELWLLLTGVLYFATSRKLFLDLVGQSLSSRRADGGERIKISATETRFPLLIWIWPRVKSSLGQRGGSCFRCSWMA